MLDADLKPSVKMVREYLNPKGGVTPIFAICEILGIPAYAVAEALDITRPRMSHYRSGEASVPESRMQEVRDFLKLQISEIEKEIAKERKKSPNKTIALLINDLERRVDLARKIANL